MHILILHCQGILWLPKATHELLSRDDKSIYKSKLNVIENELNLLQWHNSLTYWQNQIEELMCSTGNIQQNKASGNENRRSLSPWNGVVVPWTENSFCISREDVHSIYHFNQMEMYKGNQNCSYQKNILLPSFWLPRQYLQQNMLLKYHHDNPA